MSRPDSAWLSSWGGLAAAGLVSAIVLVFTGLGALEGNYTSPRKAVAVLTAGERFFAVHSEAADFIAFLNSEERSEQLNKRLRGADAPEISHDQWSVAVSEDGSAIQVHLNETTATRARRAAQVTAGYVRDSVAPWVSRRTNELSQQLEATQRRLGEVRARFEPFGVALLTADLASLRQALANEASNKAARVRELKAELVTAAQAKDKEQASAAPEKPVLRNLKQELAQALTRFTEEHPKVKELRASIASLQQAEARQAAPDRDGERAAELEKRVVDLRAELADTERDVARSNDKLVLFSGNEVEFSRLQAEHSELTRRRDELIRAQVAASTRGARDWQATEPVIYRLTSPWRVVRHAATGGFMGACVGGLILVARRRSDRFVKSSRALHNATGLPVLATLPKLTAMSEREREYWALETLELLRRNAGAKRRGTFVCGFISAEPGEGCSTWIDLLARAGLRNGHRVLVLSQPRSTNLIPPPRDLQPTALFAPDSTPDSSAIARYSVSGSASHAPFQKQWERAVTTWNQEEDAVVLVELPPATTSDALLLSPALPNVVWLSAANSTSSSKVRHCVKALNNIGCNLIGAVLNRSCSPRIAMLLIALLLAFATSHAQEPQVSNVRVTTNTPTPSSGIKLAPWQERLTLGPGDVIDVSLYGQPETSRPGLMITPDGRLNYLQARDFPAAGLTVDELRTKLEEALAKFHLAPRVVIVPTLYRSKKYFMLGNVVAPGAFVLDRPLTIVEAVARAKGFVSGGGARANIGLADLQRAFLVRRQGDGQFAYEPVDFEKLFMRGELSENRELAPEDYLYFPPVAIPEVYVLGEVTGTGPVNYSKELTVLGAIASKGGFTDASFRQKVLVVRGSLQNPETFVIDAAKPLRAASPDFLLQPRDIIYVSRKPWAKAEEILKSASSDFLRAMVVTWTGREIHPLLR